MRVSFKMKKGGIVFLLSIICLMISSCGKNNDELAFLEYDTEAIVDSVEDRLEFLHAEENISFGFLPDLHYENNQYYRSSTAKLVKDINRIHKKYPLAGVYLGGDNMANSYNRKELKSDTKKMVESFRTMEPLVYFLKGNHDDNSLRGRIDKKNEANVNAEISDEELVDMYANSLYSYCDFEKQCVRIVYLNSIDVPFILEGKKIKYPGQWCYGYQQEQLEFLGKEALNFESKANASAWKIIILQHLTSANGYTDGVVYNEDVFWSLLDAYQNASTYEVDKMTDDFSVHLKVDFTKQSKGTIIGIIQGHIHRDKSSKVNGINVIATKKSGLLEENQLGYSMDIFTIDTKNNKLYSTRYGDGENREWNF